MTDSNHNEEKEALERAIERTAVYRGVALCLPDITRTGNWVAHDDGSVTGPNYVITVRPSPRVKALIDADLDGIAPPAEETPPEEEPPEEPLPSEDPPPEEPPVVEPEPDPATPPVVTLTGQTLAPTLDVPIRVGDTFYVSATLQRSDGTTRPASAYRLYGFDSSVIGFAKDGWTPKFIARAVGTTVLKNDNLGTTGKATITVLAADPDRPPADPTPPAPIEPPPTTEPPATEPPPAEVPPPPPLTLIRRSFTPAELHWVEATSTDRVDVIVALEDGSMLTLVDIPLGLHPLRDLDGSVHDHLAVARYKDGVVIENCWLNSTKNLAGQLTILVNGAVAFDQPDVKFWLWSRTVPQRTGLPQYTPVPIDKALLPAYGNPGPLKSLAGVMNTAEAGINGKGYATYDAMGATGGRIDIGILPAWDLPYAVQGAYWQDCRDANDHATVWPIHVRDPETGMPVDPIRRPTACLLTAHLGYNYGKARGTNPITGKTSCPYEADSAHQTHFATVPYLATHSDFDLEEFEFWSSYQGIWNNASYRGYEKAIVSGSQTRGIAWSLVQYFFAAKHLPEGNPLKASFITGLANSVVAHWGNQYAPGKPKHNIFGFDPQVAYMDKDKRYRGIAPWMNHYLAGALNLGVWYGFTDYIPWRDWSAGFAVGCMTKMCYQVATFYNLWPIPVEGYVKGGTANMVTTWDDLRRETLAAAYDGAYANQVDLPCGELTIGSRPKGMMSGATGGAWSYPATIQQALAAGVDAGLPGADEAWALHQKYSGNIDYTGANEENIVPRSMV